MFKKLLLSGALVTGTLLSGSAQNTPSWLRYPSISPDGQTIVFTYKGDLYRVPSAGGAAIPLTAHEAHDFMPVWSPDGKSIVFASDRYGNFDLFKIPATGGEATRMTFHSVNEYPYDFSADGKTVYFGSTRMDMASNRQYPAFYLPELYQVPVNGGRVQQVLTTPAEDVQVSKDGQTLIYHDRKGGENQWRKHHVSAVTRDLWRYEAKTGKHTKLTTFNGEDRNPVFAENEQTIFYLSEESGTFNVHKISASGQGKSTQVTKFTKHPVRFLSVSDNSTLCFSFDGELYTLQGNGVPKKVPVTLAVDAKTNNERLVQVAGSGVQDLAVSPNGKEIAFIYRGEVFVSAVEGNVTKRITDTPEQERSVSFSPDGKTLLYASERGNLWKIYQTQIARKEEPYFYASTLLNETPLIDNEHENYAPQFSPDGKEVAFVENRNTIKVLNLASKQVRTLLTNNELFSMRDNDLYFTWSPDSKWLAFDFSEPGYWNGEIGLISADGKGKKINLTESGFQDTQPQWMMAGNMLIWHSTREGMRTQANSGGSQSDIYAMFLTQEAFDKFKLSKEDFALVKEQEEKLAKEQEKEKDKKKKKTDAEVLKIDWEGLKTRKARLTLHSSTLGDALVSKDGSTLYYLARFEKGYNLWSTNLRTKETKMAVTLNANRASMDWDKEQKHIFLLADGKVIKLDPASSKQENVSISGDLNLNIAAERAFMLEHVWRRTAKAFYTTNLHGTNWADLKPDYEKYLPHISNNYEFSELLSELLGELNVSHSGASFSNVPANADATASLGIFYDQTYTGNGLKIDEVLLEGPLKKAGLDVSAGMVIEKIDGETLTPDKDYAQFLNRKAGKNTLLTIYDPATKKRRDITVKPISAGEENVLLYKRWVKRNAEEVDRLSNGQLGYVHIPGMNDPAFRTVYEDVMGKYANRKGMVVDTRNNSGGDLVADLAMFLSGKQFLSYTTDSRSVGMEPFFRWTKPSIALANEANYSDGHCFAFSYQDLKLGKLVGMPVPGTCTFGGWEVLQDNSLRWGVPSLGVKDVQGRYLENAQTEPDVKVMNEFDLMSKGRDQQLEAAVQELLKEVK
ncbi:S41 family peptidase [Rufibacter quisquiliarum]|uniref:Tricorn protease homolog n=1 Tax=Rufibacter quisquiliarum TaxID=1549639 RepID=A0A839GU05_9BACT|nr:S41 family peptidase [Rufibacter quisquiliarum]MBA9077271.1 Tol biopolymer transport system component/C-terminal processing protease CtpA/Prc [Rufibacter quisquiliarum]